MEASLFHLGFYDAQAAYKADTSGRKVKVHYTINAGKRTLIDTIGYQLQLPELQQFAMAIVYWQRGYPYKIGCNGRN